MWWQFKRDSRLLALGSLEEDNLPAGSLIQTRFYGSMGLVCTAYTMSQVA